MKTSGATARRQPNVNLQALEVFCEVVRRQSFSRAGARLGISQSAVSQMIAHLESELGCLLINRKRRPLRLTSEGEIYHQGCQAILHDHRALRDRLQRRRRDRATTVRVASIYSVGLHSLDHYIRGFMTEQRGATVHLEYLHPNRVYLAIVNDEADVGVISYPQAHRQLEIIPWVDERMVLVCTPSHALARRHQMRLDELEGENFVAFDRDLKIRRAIDRSLKERRIRVEIVSEFDNIETIKQALEISHAVSILPRPTIERELERGTLVEIALSDFDLTRPVALIFKRDRELTLTAARFIRSLFPGVAPQSETGRLLREVLPPSRA